MVIIINILVMFLLSILTVSFLPNILPWGVVPILPLFFIVGLTYVRKGFEPILLAALAGVFLDFFSAFGFGLYLGIFLGVAILIRLMYQEEMRELSFGAYVRLGSLGLGFCYVVQLVIMYLNDVDVLTYTTLLSFLRFAYINLLFLLFGYVLFGWYFDRAHKIEDIQKRR